MVQGKVAERGADFLLRRAGAIPPRLGNVQIMSAVLRNHLGQSSPPEKFKLLLLYPRAVLPGLIFPIPVRSAQISATRMPLEQNGLTGECAQEQVQGEGVGVCSRRVSVPFDLN